MRTCVGCRRRSPAAGLLRVGRLPGGRLTLDRAAPGRGAWVCPDPACVAVAGRRRGFERAFRAPVEPGDVDRIEEATRRSGGRVPMCEDGDPRPDPVPVATEEQEGQ